MGINRGPSMGFAILLATGMEPVAALTAIRRVRPIAAISYAGDALDRWHRISDTPAAVAGQRFGLRRSLRWRRSMYASGEHDITTIARVVNVSRATVYRVLAMKDAQELATG